MRKYEGAVVTIVLDDGKIETVPYSEDLLPYLAEIHSGANPCFECQNFYNCPKVWNTPKGNIVEYPFIKQGYMITTEKEEEDGIVKRILEFAIDKCDNYTKTPPKQKPTLQELKTIRENFRELYEEAFHTVIEKNIPAEHAIFVKRNKRGK